jgi:hypothetical protein
MTPTAQAMVLERLEELDQRFLDATVDDAGASLIPFFGAITGRSGWWWRRKPWKLIGPFAEQLLS